MTTVVVSVSGPGGDVRVALEDQVDLITPMGPVATAETIGPLLDEAVRRIRRMYGIES